MDDEDPGEEVPALRELGPPRGGAALGPRERLPVDRRAATRDRAAAELGYTDDLGNLVV